MLTPQQLEEKMAKGVFYNCYNKYTKCHKCSEKNLFYINCEQGEEKEEEKSKEEDIIEESTPRAEKEEMNLAISCN